MHRYNYSIFFIMLHYRRKLENKNDVINITIMDLYAGINYKNLEKRTKKKKVLENPCL